MNLQALQEIIDNNVEILESSARDNGADENTVVGIAKYAVGNGFEKLSGNQKYHFDNCIRHLIEDVAERRIAPNWGRWLLLLFPSAW